jgi:hypothetical protein
MRTVVGRKTWVAPELEELAVAKTLTGPTPFSNELQFSANEPQHPDQFSHAS